LRLFAFFGWIGEVSKCSAICGVFDDFLVNCEFTRMRYEAAALTAELRRQMVLQQSLTYFHFIPIFPLTIVTLLEVAGTLIPPRPWPRR
jgi:hypothetical protein